MTITNYANTSPYYNTPQTSWYLSTWVARPIPAFDTDQCLTLQTRYNNRPDLLSYDLYGTTRLWWVFAIRNPNIIKDPIYDFVPGIQISVTNRDVLLGILNA